MSDIVKVRLFVRTDKVGSECYDTLEFEKEEWDSMDDKERQKLLFEMIWDMAEWGWEEEDEDE